MAAEAIERLEAALEAYALLLEPVEPPQDQRDFLRYFCGNTEVPTDLAERAPRREALYKAVASLVRAYANLADESEAAGYTEAETQRLKARQKEAAELRETVRLASGENLDLKAYEADMRHLIDTYIQADEPRKVSPFDDLPLLEIIEKLGIDEAVNRLPRGIRADRASVAETVENNVRRKIVTERPADPAFFDQMSALLAKIIEARNHKALEYEAYLARIAELARRVQAGGADETPAALDTPGRRALYNNLGQNEALAVQLDETVKRVRPDAWRGVEPKERVIKGALYGILADVGEVERVFALLVQQPEY